MGRAINGTGGFSARRKTRLSHFRGAPKKSPVPFFDEKVACPIFQRSELRTIDPEGAALVERLWRAPTDDR
jgi:hypothetical protein